jgi:putative ABC transport system ATP-binding protein
MFSLQRRPAAPAAPAAPAPPATRLQLATPHPVIEITDLVKTYGTGRIQVTALAGVDLLVERGDFVAIMGASGSGKSTLMNILGCLDVPTRGRFLLDGVDVRTLEEATLAQVRNRKIGFVFQSFNLIPRTSAVANVELPLVAGVRAKERRARALVSNPALLLADEPTGNLDSASTAEIMGLFAALNAEGRTVVLITHEEEVARFATGVVRLRDGRIQSDTRPTRSFAGPVSARPPVPGHDSRQEAS